MNNNYIIRLKDLYNETVVAIAKKCMNTTDNVFPEVRNYIGGSKMTALVVLACCMNNNYSDVYDDIDRAIYSMSTDVMQSIANCYSNSIVCFGKE
ncbi:MAG: hypothetical protein AABY32_01610 [Nanoarchaeota archaeon]